MNNLFDRDKFTENFYQNHMIILIYCLENTGFNDSQEHKHEIWE